VLEKRALDLKLHQTKLNNLVKSNDLEIVKVAADGNCLLEATLLQTESGESVDEFRCTICSHIERNKQYYKTFTTVTDVYFDKCLEDLRGHGHWNNMLGDIMPLSISNVLCRPITIYSSKIAVIDIFPTLTGNDTPGQKLLYSLLTITGREHYDACKKKQRQSSGNQNAGQSGCIPEKNPENACQEGITLEDHPSTNQNEDTFNAPVDAQEETPNETDGEDVNITTRKTAEYLSPRSKPRSRKRKALPHKLNKNVRNQLRLTGKEYVSSRGKTISRRRMKQHNCSNCRFKCASKITEEERQTIFDLFWALDSYKRKTNFIVRMFLKKKVQVNQKGRK